eukprot:NODE_10703_length_299_cov_0.795082.p3 GENE.NODE_10703_length_299_cov_0.795082~~NODE_10703_length_299_cov_0.795082.p3  ORF type:complete len:84 (-),score=2.59 NODE_10703_length_299_cov_0.795082:33-284(-)
MGPEPLVNSYINAHGHCDPTGVTIDGITANQAAMFATVDAMYPNYQNHGTAGAFGFWMEGVPKRVGNLEIYIGGRQRPYVRPY